MGYNTPDDVRDNDSNMPWNKDDSLIHYDNCWLCGGEVYLEITNGRFSYKCDECGLEATHSHDKDSARFLWEDKATEFNLACPNCFNASGLKIARGLPIDPGYHVQCECGVSGPYGFDERDALRKWINLLSMIDYI